MQSSLEKLRNQFNDIKDKMTFKTTESTIEKLITNKFKINESETAVINEIIASSKIKNPKGCRYSENWLLLCILLHIR